MKRQTRTFLLNAFTGIAIAATAALVLLPTVASAAPAVATSFVNVRERPSTTAAVVNTLNAGEAIDVQECEGSWCYVAASGNDGWVARRFIGTNAPGGSIQFGITGPNGNTIQFGVNAPPVNNPVPPPEPPDVDEPDFASGEACFFSRSQYRGTSFCIEAGERISDLGDWDGDISSIDNPDELDVTVCTRTRYRGDCRTYTTSARSLGSFDDSIASIRID
jgi:uncharacterized protein YraI